MRIRFSLSDLYYKITLVSIFLAMDLFVGRFISWFDDATKLIACALCVFACISCYNSDILRKNVIYVILVLFAMIVLSSVNGMPLTTTIGIGLRFFTIFGFLIWAIERGYDVRNDVFDMLYIFTIISLIFFFLFDYGLYSVPYSIVKYYGLHGDVHLARSYMKLYYRPNDQFTRKLFGYDLLTSNGLWNEPGAYQIFPSFALFISMFCKSEKKVYKMIILSFAIITAQSTMGIILLLILWAIKIYENAENLIVKIILPIGLIPITSVLLISIIREKMNTTNWYSRVNNMQNMLIAIKQNPIIGSGQRYDIWSGAINYFANYGLLGFIIIYVIIQGVKENIFRTSKYGNAAFLAWWTLCMINEPYGYNNLLFIIYAYIIIRISKTNDYGYERIVVG